MMDVLAELTQFCGADGFSVRGAAIPASPLAADRTYGLDPAVDRERYARIPGGYRLRGFYPDPMDNPGTKPGRSADIVGPLGIQPVVSNYTEAQRASAITAMLERYASADEVLYDGPNGRLERHGPLHVMVRNCRNCGQNYTRWRFASQRRKWGWSCSAECQRDAKRRADRERIRAKRGKD
ncbi:hypothetical protein [Streptomyces sp. NPDC020917]|uniref:hypothetical protein n=1 Tax=Streptomyces sp. NPDC020917 TaxID=3365102 RepID=UPI0037AEBBA2